MQIDVSLVCGSRPKLLTRMMASFDGNIFSGLALGNVFVNIDPFGGDSRAQRECRSIVYNYFPAANIRMAADCSFGAAVKHLWALPTSRVFLHLEDDWLAIRKYDLSAIASHSKSRVKQIQLAKPHFPASLWTRYRFRPLLSNGVFIPNPMRPSFSTSPSLIESSFAHEVSKLLDPKLDPEKQFFNGQNGPLEMYLRAFRAKALLSFYESPVIEDIGRAWQRENLIRAEFVNGKRIYRRI